MTKVKMIPSLSAAQGGVGGINTLIQKYHKYMPEYGFEFTEDDNSCELLVVHAGTTDKILEVPIVSMIHGLYWGNSIAKTLRIANAHIVNILRRANQITVPSNWVAETIRRDLRINPHIIPHGVDWDEWQHQEPNEGYIIWNKNISNDVCNPIIVNMMAKRFPDKLFLTTFAAPKLTPNIKVTSPRPHQEMKTMIKKASVYLSTAKETFGIGCLEALASGVPVLGWATGGNLDLVKHGVTGYLAQSGNYEDFANGLQYCIDNRDILSKNARELSKVWTWDKACQQVAGVWRLAIEPEHATVGVVIPVYNKPIDAVKRTINSALNQTYKPQVVVIVDDGSEEELSIQIKSYVDELNIKTLIYVKQHNQGVAIARNTGIALADTKYICCIDSDDWIEPNFLEICIIELEKDRTMGIAYTGLTTHDGNGSSLSEWPPSTQDYDRQISYYRRFNQIPTCCVFRRNVWERTGGYRQRYAPDGAGSEDAAFWTLFGSLGYTAKKVTSRGLFNYSAGGQVSSNRSYSEQDWLAFYPWARDDEHPFCSIALPKTQPAHNVPVYDEPLLSIIIPVGPKHEKDVYMALDSIEAQSFRDWEVVLVNDTGYNIDEYLKPYPFVVQVDTEGEKGAGFARNRGVDKSRGKLLLFLDADDFINLPRTQDNKEHYNKTLEVMVRACIEREEGIYTGFIGRCYPESVESLSDDIQKRIINISEKDGEVYYTSPVPEFDCMKAIEEPNHGQEPYVWNLISTMIPKLWHYQIDGFDEELKALEDWEYWIRLAKFGKCFSTIPGYHFVYRYYSGTRRETINETYPELIAYIIDKHNDIEVKDMACGCSKRKNNKIREEKYISKIHNVKKIVNSLEVRSKSMSIDTNNSMIEVRYISKLAGKHNVRGVVSKTNYGYKQRGEVFSIYPEDAVGNQRGHFEKVREAMIVQEPTPVKILPPTLVKPIVNKTTVNEVVKQTPPPVEVQPKYAAWEAQSEEVVKSTGKLDLASIPGVSKKIAVSIELAGFSTVEDFLSDKKDALERLIDVKGVGSNRAAAILEYLEML